MQTSSESWGLGQGLATNDIFAKMKNLTFELNSHRYFGSFIQRMLRRRKGWAGTGIRDLSFAIFTSLRFGCHDLNSWVAPRSQVT